METAAFVIGLNELIGIYDNACRIWRTIAEANDYGEDMAEYMGRLEMEFFKFDLWWSYAESMSLRAAKAKPAQAAKPTTGDAPEDMKSMLRAESTQPIQKAAAAVLKLLEDIQKLLASYGVLKIIGEPVASTTPQLLTQPAPDAEPEVDIITGASSIKDSQQRRTVLATSLQKKTSWRKRIKSKSTPWKEADSSVLEQRLVTFTWWNNFLFSILPDTIRNSLLRQGLSAYFLDAPDVDTAEVADLEKSTNDSQSEVLGSARLLSIRRQFEKGGSTDSDIAKRLKQTDLDIDLLTIEEDESLRSSAQYTVEGKGEQEVLVEWYKYSNFTDSQKAIALERLQKLCLIFSQTFKPSTLHVLSSLGVLEDVDKKAFGLVSHYPPNTDWSKLPTSLHNLIQNKTLSKPSLEQRRRLAQRVSSALFALMVLRWYHKRFTSRHILFFTRSIAPRKVDLDNPYITGFDVARPDHQGEESINEAISNTEAIYYHPELRQTDSGNSGRNKNKQPPPYDRKYDIYALGITLLEIAFWQSADQIVATKLKPEQTIAELKTKCDKDLPFYMGKRYASIVSLCLTAGGGAGGGAGSTDDEVPDIATSLPSFYGNVVRDLIDREI